MSEYKPNWTQKRELLEYIDKHYKGDYVGCSGKLKELFANQNDDVFNQFLRELDRSLIQIKGGHRYLGMVDGLGGKVNRDTEVEIILMPTGFEYLAEERSKQIADEKTWYDNKNAKITYENFRTTQSRAIWSLRFSAIAICVSIAALFFKGCSGH